MANVVFGDNTSKCSLWIDLWGMSKLLEDHYTSNADLLAQSEIAHRLSIFISYLAVAARDYPDVEILQGSDGAFIISDNPDRVFELAVVIFQNISFLRGKFIFMPLRAGFAQNLVEVESNREELAKLTNFSYLPYIGEAFAKGYKMESFGDKGMRLFIVESLARKISSAHQKRVSSVPVPGGVAILKEPAEQYFEVNWMDDKYLEAIVDGQKTKEHYENLANSWLANGNVHQQAIGQSLIDLMLSAPDL